MRERAVAAAGPPAVEPSPPPPATSANGDGTVYQRKDGRWEAAGYVLAPGNSRRRVRVYGTTRKVALVKLTEKIAASNRGLPVPSAQGSVAVYLTYWLENVAVHHLRENTHTRYSTCVNRYLIPGLGKKKLTKVTAKDVRTWLNQLRITCQCCTRAIDARRDQPRCYANGQCYHRLLSPLTLTYIHSVLKSALEHAVCEEEIPRNVARNVRTGTPRPRRFEPLTAAEARQRLTAPQGHRLHALFELALHTGLRKGELLGLRWEDVNLDAGTAAIRRTSAGGLTTLPTKTRASERRIALPTRCLQSLKLHHKQQKIERGAAGATCQHGGHVFTTAQGRPIDPTNLTRTFNTILRKTGLRRAHIGVTAGVYAHVRLRLQRQAIDTLNDALGSVEEHPDDPLAAALVR